MTNDELLIIFKKSGALLEGHFQLTSGLHSRQYFQCAKVLQYPEYATTICGMIAKHFQSSRINIVIAPALGGIIVAQEVGRILNSLATNNADQLRILFTERKDNLMQLRRGFEIHPGERVLVCEDVITTGGSVSEVIEIVRREGGEVAGVGSIVDRSGGKVNFNNTLFAAMSMQVVTYKPEDCPLCAKGVPVEKPGSRGNAPKS
ncbi:MAG: orotate phosphoribosyltransferase [Bacteroidota bacterium]